MYETEKPRERLFLNGSSALSNEELLAIIIKTGTKNKSCKELATIILKEFNGIENLKNATISKLSNINGIGKVKAIEILASLELGKRVYNYKNKNIVLNNTKLIYETFKDEFLKEKQEKFYAIYLDSKNKLINYKMLFKGTSNASTVHPREIFKGAFEASAVGLIVIHNHPSGDATPSEPDIDITNRLIQISGLMGFRFLDHIIFGENTFYSFYEQSKIK